MKNIDLYPITNDIFHSMTHICTISDISVKNRIDILIDKAVDKPIISTEIHINSELFEKFYLKQS